MNKLTLLIGGNEGNRELLINQATELIRERMGSVVALSRVYETEPWGEFEEERGKWKVENFLNRALLVETTLSPWQVLRTALSIEAGLGRRRLEKSTPQSLRASSPVSGEQRLTWCCPAGCSPETGELPEGVRGGQQSMNISRVYHSRPMDIDLIFYDDLVLDTPELTLPHPRMHLRRFVLEPLAEIMSDYRHPLLGRTVLEMLEECPATPSGFSKDGGAVCAGVSLRSTPACNPTSRMRDLSAEPPQGVNGIQAGDLSPVKEERGNVEPQVSRQG